MEDDFYILVKVGEEHIKFEVPASDRLKIYVEVTPAQWNLICQYELVECARSLWMIYIRDGYKKES